MRRNRKRREGRAEQTERKESNLPRKEQLERIMKNNRSPIQNEIRAENIKYGR